MAPRSARLLLVVPDRRVRGALRTLLAAGGFRVVAEAGDFRHAREAALACRPDVALVDPLLSTPAAGCDFIRTLCEELSTAVVALTSNPALRGPALRAGAADVLTTTECQPEDLLTALRHAAPPAQGGADMQTRTDSAREPLDSGGLVANRTIPDLFAAAAAAHPDKPCLVPGDDDRPALTFAQAAHAVGLTAQRLRDAGIGPDDKVAVLSPNDTGVVIATLALLSIGAAWLPINARESTATVTALLDQFGCDLLIAHPDLESEAKVVADGVPTVRGVLDLHRLTGPGDGYSVPRLPPAAQRDPADRALAAIFPTGGTTGRPKGVAYTHQRLGAIAEAYARVQAHPGDVYLAAAPLTHVGGRICLSVLASGGTVVILPSFDETAVLRTVERHRITTLTVTSTMLYRLIDAARDSRYDTSSLRALVYGGGPTAISRIREALGVFGPVLEGGYGQTEAPMFITRFRAEDHLVDGKPAPDARLRSVGRPTEVSDVRIVDSAGNEVPRGETGRVIVRGPFTMNGYYRNPAETAARRAGEFHSTGDLGFLDEDGFLTLVGRESDVIITGGFNVYPAEVENVLAAQPGVRECAVVGVPDERW